MKKLSLCLVLFIAVFFEGSFTTIPLVLDVLLVSFVLSRDSWVFLASFLLGILLDIISLRLIGTTSIVFIILLFILTLYEKKFEVKTVYFVFLSSFFGSLIFLIVFGYDYVLQQAMISSFIAVLIFKIFGKIEKKKLLTN